MIRDEMSKESENSEKEALGQAYKEDGDKRQEEETYGRLAKAYMNIGQYQIAIEYFQKAQNIALERGDKRKEGQAYLGLGDAYRNIGQYQTAIEYSQKAQNIAIERGDKWQEGHSSLGLGDAYRNIVQYQTAIEYFQKAQNIALERGDKWQEGEAYLGLGYVYRNIGQNQTAIEYFQKAQNIAIERGDKRQEGEAYLGLGNAYLDIGQNQTAVEYFQKAQNIALECGNKLQKGQACLGLGNVCLNSGKYQTAIEYYQIARNITLQRGDNLQEGQAYLGLGNVYMNIGQYETAIQYFQKAQNIAFERGNKLQEGQAYLGLGNVYLNIGPYQTAIEYYRKAQNIALERGNKLQEGQVYLGLGNVYCNIGQYQTSIEYFQKAQNIALKRGDKREEGQAYLGLGIVYLNSGQYQTAMEYFQKAHNIALERGNKWQEGRAYQGLGDLYLNSGESEKAIECYQKAKIIALECGGKIQEVHEVFLKLRYAVFNQRQKIGEEINKDLHRQEKNETCCSEKTISFEEMPPVEAQMNVLWSKTSIKHRKKFENFVRILKTEPTMVATKIGQYRVCLKPKFVIGRGSDGTTVYIGLSDDGIEVAVKSLLLDRCKQIGSNEKEILNSPMVRKEQHVVNYRFYTEEVDSVNAYLVLDLCEENLQEYVLSEERTKELLQSNGPAFVRQILHGLKALHCGNPVILHRDLKPSNIFVNVEGEMVLADFGLSRKLTGEETTHRSDQRGTQGWIAVESLPTEEDGDCLSIEERKVRYKKQSDIQVAGMVIFYILTKGGHPYGPSHFRTSNLAQGKPVNLNKLDNPLAKDLIDWMLQHDLRARPSVEECLQHPYLMSTDEKFHFVTRVGNELEIKTNDVKSVVVKQLNADPSLPKPSWKTKIDAEVMSYVSGRRFYSDDVADLVRLIRNTAEHWRDKTPPSTVQAKVGSPKEYFLNLFPTLPVVLHRIIREDPDWKQREQLKQFF